MNEIEKFQEEVRERIQTYQGDEEMRRLALEWTRQGLEKKYVYNFTWLGRPVIQTPQDIVGIQELIWTVKPDLVIETGVAHGGSLILSASILELLGGERKSVGIDIDIRAHNRVEIENHPMFKRIELIEGSSTSDEVAEEVRAIASGYSKVMIFLDSYHTHEHVKKEISIYAPLVSVGSYLVVFDTFVEDLPPEVSDPYHWSVGDNPKTAVLEFLSGSDEFEVDSFIEGKLQITHARGGFLKRVNPPSPDA